MKRLSQRFQVTEWRAEGCGGRTGARVNRCSWEWQLAGFFAARKRREEGKGINRLHWGRAEARKVWKGVGETQGAVWHLERLLV